MIKLNMLCSPNTQALPYHADMPLWQYLREVIAPASGLPLDKDGVSLTSCVVRHIYNSPSGEFTCQVRFNYANRLLRLGDVVPPDGALFLLHAPFHSRMDDLRGNASPRADTQATCAICLDDARLCDFKLCCCSHAFHMDCMHAMPPK